MSLLWPIGLSLALVVALAQGCVLVALFAALGRLTFRAHSRYQALITEDGPALNNPLPELQGQDARTDARLSSAQFLGRRLVALFISPGCDVCDDVLDAVSQWQRGRPDDVAFLFVVQAAAEEAAAYLERLPGVSVLADPDGQIGRAWGVERMPLGVLADAWGYMRMKGIINSSDQLAGLISGQGRSMAGLSWTADLDDEEEVLVSSGPA